ncbi:D-2-hydroxyacid dehydrogenase [Staphylococcus equorum]|uniref:D-2-hydroxyacid dehydrogenase n=1 Tax=Staphylococcus equorum TaxID=246432 RepID=UPI001E54647B|nr:D-2-hydroxyacid dehydrogenase [Staphylococcus equorum]MCM3071966.1 D-2-hydroxyacid dehydrogenase [Staphylococcus equorum]MCZ4235344.1 D-2-hydroxyacid dehydrogenase [Staphylococcus equorum]MEB7671341.1 D-2-hydroxyacid dehydrogenase [Staphylococcus equorum]MEB7673864.1 D-2-hydroxyacid dehydrogenase [Staphylococcus equorum]MEB7689992.1 D-2-hydroxyacid dehydrogenase [Staphylococcus equorum]
MKLNIQNILIAGQYESAFQQYLMHLEKYHLRFQSIDMISEGDMEWADAYVGFAPSKVFHPAKVSWVHAFNAGVNNFLAIDGWKTSNTVLTRTVSDFGEKMSEYCLSYILKDLQHHKLFQSQQKDKIWSCETPAALKDQTITIFGTGETGKVIAKVLSSFGTTVYGVSSSGENKRYFKQVNTLETSKPLIEQSDYIISTLPLTQQTEKLFNEQIFSYLNNAYFINVGRGQGVDTNHLIKALDSEKVRHAVLDVFESEPLPKSSELWHREDVTITPHISALTDLDDAISCFYNTLEHIERDETLSNQVDCSRGY